MFKNLKIGVRLGIGFGLVVLLLAIVALVSFTRVGVLNDKINDLVGDKYPKTVWATDIIRAMNNIAVANRNTLLMTDARDLDEQRANRSQFLKTIEEREAKLKETITSEEGKKLLSDMMARGDTYLKTLDKFGKTNQAGDRAGAIEILYGEFGPVTEAYINSIRALVKFQDDLMEKTGAGAEELANETRTLILILSIAALVISAGFAWWVTRSITRPVNEAVGAANRLAEGDLTVRIESDTKDEVGQLMVALQNMIAKLSGTISEVRTAADNLSNAAGQVSATAQSLSQSSSEQAASVEETTSSMEEMTASISQNT